MTTMKPVRRIVTGQHVFRGDAQHLHHRMLQAGLSPRGALVMLWGLCACFGLTAILLAALPRHFATLLIAALALVLVGMAPWNLLRAAPPIASNADLRITSVTGQAKVSHCGCSIVQVASPTGSLIQALSGGNLLGIRPIIAPDSSTISALPQERTTSEFSKSGT
mgnify:CR=1 FL=1